METALGSTAGITHRGPCAHVRAPRATCTGTHHRAHAILAPLRSHLMVDVTPRRRWEPWSLPREEGGGRHPGRPAGPGLLCTPCSLTPPQGKGTEQHPPTRVPAAQFCINGPVETMRNVAPDLRKEIINKTTQMDESSSRDQSSSGDGVGGSRRSFKERKAKLSRESEVYSEV